MVVILVIKKLVPAALCFSFSFCGFSSLFGMDSQLAEKQEESRSTALFSERSVNVMEVINATQKGGDIRFESPFFSDGDIVNALCRAAERGVAVSVHVGSRSRANREKMLKSGVLVKEIDGLHAKRVIVSQPCTKKRKNGEKENMAENVQDSETRVFVGSDNLSYLSRGHKEIMVETQNDSIYYGKNRLLFTTPDDKEKKRKKVLGFTPRRRSVVDSRDYFTNQSKALRLKNLKKSSDQDDSVDITSMTFDNEDIVSAVEQVYKKRKENRPKFRFIFDRSALCHKDLLDRIKNAGDSDASIYIYNADTKRKLFQKFPQIQHTKTMTRECDGKKLAIVSTGNLTNQSDLDFNIDSYHPGDTQLFNDIRFYNNALATECQEYTS